MGMDFWIPLPDSRKIDLESLRCDTEELGNSYMNRESQGEGDVILLDLVRNGMAKMLAKHGILIGSMLDIQMNFDDYRPSVGEAEGVVPSESKVRVCGILADCYLLEHPTDDDQDFDPYDIDFVIEAGVIVPETNGSLSACIDRSVSSTDNVWGLPVREMISMKVLSSE